MDNDVLAGLVKRAKQGDTGAFGSIYDMCVDAVYRYVYARVGQRQDAEDVTEEVFISAFKAVGRYEQREVPFTAWLFRIARNATADHHRHRNDRPDTAVPCELAADIADPVAHQAIGAGLAVDELAGLLNRLTDDQRQVLTLRFIVGFRINEVARQISKSDVAVKALQHRALSALQKIMEQES